MPSRRWVQRRPHWPFELQVNQVLKYIALLFNEALPPGDMTRTLLGQMAGHGQCIYDQVSI